MPSEYVMYLSIVLVGTLAIAGISATMVSLNTTLENRSIETSLEQILQKISESINELKTTGEMQIENGATDITLQMSLSIPKTIENEEYVIEVQTLEVSDYYFINASLINNKDIKSSISLFVLKEEITITGSITSKSDVPSLLFLYDGENMRIKLQS